MQPFDSFTLGHFRGLSGLTLEGLGRINVLVGANNSGKSSILEALELACDPMDPFSWIAIADQRDSRSNSIDRVDNVLWMFPFELQSDAGHRAIELNLSGANPIVALVAKIELRTSSPEESAEDVRGRGFGDGPLGQILSAASRRPRRVLVVAVSGHTMSSEATSDFTIIEGQPFLADNRNSKLRTPCASIAPLSHRDRSIHAERLSQAKESGLVGDAVALLQQFDPEIQDLDILARQGTFADLRIRHRTLGLAPLNAFGDGMRRALLYALTLPQVRGGVLLIDEIESAIHVKALGGVFTWLTHACEQFAVQLFASTHSLEALESLLGDDEQSASQVVGYHLPSRSSGGVVMRYEGGLLARLIRDRGLDVR